MKLIDHPDLQIFLHAPDHIDVKTIEGNLTLREFIAGFLSYYPWWIKGLYGIRGVFVRLLGMKQEQPSTLPVMTPERVAFTEGADGTIFTVQAGKEDQYWVASASDKHLTATVIILMEHLETTHRFHVGTIVHYHHWTGPVYFNVIRPFHHLVVRAMMQSAITYPTRTLQPA